jgi:rhodanese-related sulfurtransferase
MQIKKGYKQLLAEANAEIETLAVEAAIRLAGQPDVVFVDLRDPREMEREGRMPGAFACTRGMLEFWIDMGLENVAHIEGGFGAWKKAGGPVEV